MHGWVQECVHGPAFAAPSWKFLAMHACLHVRVCSVPGARALATAGKSADNATTAAWCERIVLHESSQTLLALFEVRPCVCVFGCAHVVLGMAAPCLFVGAWGWTGWNGRGRGMKGRRR